MAHRTPPIHELVSTARQLRRSDPHRAYRLARRALAEVQAGRAGVDDHAEVLAVSHLLALELRHPNDAERLSQELVALLPRCSPDVVSRCKVGLGWSAYLRSDLLRALEFTREALAGLVAAGATENALWARNNLAAIYTELGAEDRAVALYIENRERSRASGQGLLEGGALLNLSMIHNSQEDSAAALDAAQQALPLLDAGDDPYAQLMARAQIVVALLNLGRPSEARVISDALYAQVVPLPSARAMVCFYQARALRHLGEYAAALQVVQEGLRAVPRTLNNEKLLLWSELAEVHEGLGDLTRATQVGRKVVEGAARLNIQHKHSPTHEMLARVAERRGRHKAALAHLKTLRRHELDHQRANRERQRLMHAAELALERAREDAERARARTAELEEALTRDGMTGLYNHAAFQDLLHRQAAQGPLAVVMFDVDNFKSYNDNHGHPAGDALLKALAAILQGHLRDEDRLARYGGEEFVLLLADHDLASACQVAERLRSAVETFEAPHRRVTVSAGVAAMPPLAADPAGLVQAADQALYRAKRGGKNRVVVAGPAGPEAGPESAPTTAPQTAPQTAPKAAPAPRR